MNKRGRNHKPLAQHKLEGTYKESRHNKKLDLEPICETPDPPEYLGAEAKKEWIRITDLLIGGGILTSMDLRMLEMYCMQFDIILECYEDIKDKGTTTKGYNDNPVKNPSWQTMKEAIDIVNKIGGKFGLTPVDRMRININPVEKDLDPLEEVMKIAK